MNKFKLIIKIKVIMLISFSSFFVQSEAVDIVPPISAQQKPNIVIIYSDDQGWGDVGYHGYSDIRTPNIDKLARQGTQFSQAYVSASVCGPSRAGLISGVYQQKFGFYGNGEKANIPRSQPTIFEMMKAQGYATGVVGKWHVGNGDGHPVNRGADFYYGFLNGAHDYQKSSNKAGARKSQAPIYRNFEKEPPIQASNGYLTEMFTDEAVGFIERSTDKPFLLYLAYNAVHHPWVVPQKYLDRLKDLQTHDERKLFAGMLLAMDDGVGAVMDTLKRQGLEENTLVFFMSDNGSPRGQGLKPPKKKKRGETVMSSPGPFNGFKGDTYEGGIRVPFIMKWPNRIASGKTYDSPVINLDIAKTMLATLGVENPDKGLPLDGVDLLPYISGVSKQSLNRVFYWRRDEDYAIREGQWKLTYNDQGGPQTIRLFNLEDDKEEYHDLSNVYPDIAQDLQNKFDQWDSHLPDNAFGKTANNRNREFVNGKIKSVANFNKQHNQLPVTDDEIINKLFRDSYQFWQQIREPNGVYRDGFQLHNKQSERGSIANAGMGLMALAIGHAQGWEPDAENLALQTLTTLSGKTPGFTPARNAAGCFMHFFNVNTGQAMSKDFSPIDTDIMLLGATFIKNYFVKNKRISQLVDELLASVDQAKFIGDPIKGQIALSMNANGEPTGAWTIPFNEYMIVAWLAKQQSQDVNSAANQLWNNHYQSPALLKKSLFGKAQTPVLSVSNKRYVTMFTFLFNYYLVHHFSNSPEYLQAMKYAAKADFSWWQEQNIAQWQSFEWGTGAGATISGYNADRIFNSGSRDENPYQIVSPHILAGFSPVQPSVKADLVAMYRAGADKAIYPLSAEVSVLWRYSLKQKHWRAKAIQGVDFSTMLFGLAALPDFLGPDFFNRYNKLE